MYNKKKTLIKIKTLLPCLSSPLSKKKTSYRTVPFSLLLPLYIIDFKKLQWYALNMLPLRNKPSHIACMSVTHMHFYCNYNFI